LLNGDTELAYGMIDMAREYVESNEDRKEDKISELELLNKLDKQVEFY